MAGARLDDVALQGGDEPRASRLQRALTAHVEEHATRTLDRDLRRLPAVQALGGEVPDPPWRLGWRVAPLAAPF